MKSYILYQSEFKNLHWIWEFTLDLGERNLFGVTFDAPLSKLNLAAL